MKRKREFERSRRSFSYSNTSLYSVSLWWTETFLIGSPLCFCWTDCPSDRPAVLLPVWFCPPGFAARRWVTISFWQSVWSRRGRRWSVEKTGCHKPDTAVSPHFPSVLRRLCAVEAAAVSSLTKFAENKEQWLQNSDFRISHKNTNDKDNAFFFILGLLDPHPLFSCRVVFQTIESVVHTGQASKKGEQKTQHPVQVSHKCTKLLQLLGLAQLLDPGLHPHPQSNVLHNVLLKTLLSFSKNLQLPAQTPHQFLLWKNHRHDRSLCCVTMETPHSWSTNQVRTMIDITMFWQKQSVEISAAFWLVWSHCILWDHHVRVCVLMVVTTVDTEMHVSFNYI